MEKLLIVGVFASLLFGSIPIAGQEQRSPLDAFIDGSETIFIARCMKVEPVDILLRARVELEIIHVIKGAVRTSDISINSRYGMKPGRRYLIALPKVDTVHGKLDHVEETIIPVSERENIDEVKKLPPRIIVLRTVNLRIDDLETIVRQSKFELEPLRALKKGN